MKIASFNIQHCNAYLEGRINYDVIANAISKLDADVVGLNEVYDKGNGVRLDAQAELLARLTGYEYYFFARAIDLHDGYYGNAILSRYPIESAEVIPVPECEHKDARYEQRCLLKVKLSGGITAMVIHFGLSREEQINAVDTVLGALEDEKCILMGDFNVTPDCELLEPIRKKLTDTAERFGSPLLSFPSDVPTQKIDYIFTSRDVAVVSADIPEIVASDHRPHVAEMIF